MTTTMHLAQLNVGRLKAPLDDPRTKDFMDQLDPVNALADTSPGFVWRLQTDEGNATAVQAYDDDELMIVNLSVWEDLEALKAFVFRSAHTPVMRRRAEWFERLDEAYLALWWVPAGHLPSVEEAVARLGELRSNGPTERVFTFREAFGPPADP